MAKVDSSDASEGRTALQQLERHLSREAALIAERRRELGEAREALTRLAASADVGNPTVTVMSTEMAPTVLTRLAKQARTIVRSLVMEIDAGPSLDEELIRSMQKSMAEGLDQRVIYPLDATRTPHAQDLDPGVGSDRRIPSASSPRT